MMRGMLFRAGTLAIVLAGAASAQSPVKGIKAGVYQDVYALKANAPSLPLPLKATPEGLFYEQLNEMAALANSGKAQRVTLKDEPRAVYKVPPRHLLAMSNGTQVFVFYQSGLYVLDNLDAICIFRKAGSTDYEGMTFVDLSGYTATRNIDHHRTSNEEFYFLDMETGQMGLINTANMDKVLRRDTEIYADFLVAKRTPSGISSTLMSAYITRYNNKHPLKVGGAR